MSAGYPPPPWESYGFGVICPYLVRVADLELPAGLSPVARLGLTLGALGYVEYRPPSPVVYGELWWMPATVSHVSARGERLQGFYVARSYVDHAGALAAGRELWHLPQSLARFQRRQAGVQVEADDGTRLGLEFSGLGPALALHRSVTTLQPRGEGLVRLHADVSGLARPARTRVRGFSSTHPGWAALPGARRAVGLGVWLERFESTLRAPEGAA